MPEEITRKLRLAYMLGVMCQMHGEESERLKDGVGGDLAMFVIPPERHAEILSPDEESGDPFQIGQVTAEDVSSILKILYGEDYHYFATRGFELRERSIEKESRKYLKRICRFLRVSDEPKLEIVYDGSEYSYHVSGFCSHCQRVESEIHISLCFDPDCICRKTIKKRLVHELLHEKGLNHNKASRRRGFYSDLHRDTLSDKVVDWIFKGGEKPPELEALRLL